MSPITSRSVGVNRPPCSHAIREDIDLTDHMADAVNSLRIVLAADESIRSHQVVTL